jgi:hypothetical protein
MHEEITLRGFNREQRAALQNALKDPNCEIEQIHEMADDGEIVTTMVMMQKKNRKTGAMVPKTDPLRSAQFAEYQRILGTPQITEELLQNTVLRDVTNEEITKAASEVAEMKLSTKYRGFTTRQLIDYKLTCCVDGVSYTEDIELANDGEYVVILFILRSADKPFLENTIMPERTDLVIPFYTIA